MSEKIIIDKESIKEFNKITVRFSESDYPLDISLLNDIKFNGTVRKRTGDIRVTDGFIEFAPKAGKKRGKLNDEYFMEEDRVTEYFSSRLLKGTDIKEIVFTAKGKELKLCLPCKPLTDCNGNVVEYSNCPSFSMSPHGNLSIYAGESSTSPKREKLVYADICKNWGWVMGENYRPDVLDLDLTAIKISEDGIGIECEVLNHTSLYSNVVFFFRFCKIHNFDVYLGNRNTRFELARMHNGHIYACLRGCNVCLECGEVAVYIEA